MAGALDEADRSRIHAAAAGDQTSAANSVLVIVISGTGASCYGQTADGAKVLTGGWGHLLGDGGSGYDIAVRSMRAVFRTLDLTGKWPGVTACRPVGR